MKKHIMKELPSSTGLYTSGSKDSLVEREVRPGYTLSKIYKLSGIKKQNICSYNELKIFLNSTTFNIYICETIIQYPILLIIDSKYAYTYNPKTDDSIADKYTATGEKILTAIELKSLIKKSLPNS